MVVIYFVGPPCKWWRCGEGWRCNW